MRLLRRGLLDSPILNRELRTLLRSRRSFFWLGLFLGALAVAFAVTWTTVDIRNADVSARRLFQTIIVTQACVFIFLAPILTAGSLSGEHERRTFQLLAITPLSGYHIALAKCFSALSYVALLVVATVPVLAITFLIGGVGWDEIAISSVAMLSTVMVAGMIGVACSAWVRRSFIALALSLAAVSVEIVLAWMLSVAPLYRVLPNPTGLRNAMNQVFIFYSALQFLLFLVAVVVAKAGYLAGSRTAPVRSKKIIRDAKLLDERKRRFPYYLIDPLKAPPPIADRANPIYVKDRRLHPLGRTDFLFRFCYVFLGISIFVGFAFLASSDAYQGRADLKDFFQTMVGVSHFVVALILLAVPLFAATAFTSEKEHGTFVPLMTTLVHPSAVLWAKLVIAVRYTVFMIVALFLPAFFEMFLMPGAPAAFLLSLLIMFPFYIVVIAASALLGLLVSARSHRTVVALTVTYLLLALFCGGPWLVQELTAGFGFMLPVSYRSVARRGMMWQLSRQGWALGDVSPVTFVAYFLLLSVGFGFLLLWTRRTVNKVLLACLYVFLLVVGPMLLTPTALWSRPGIQWGYLFLSSVMAMTRGIGPLVSPFCFLSGGSQRYWLSAMGCYENAGQIVIYCGFWAVALSILFGAAVRALERAPTSETAPSA